MGRKVISQQNGGKPLFMDGAHKLASHGLLTTNYWRKANIAAYHDLCIITDKAVSNILKKKTVLLSLTTSIRNRLGSFLSLDSRLTADFLALSIVSWRFNFRAIRSSAIESRPSSGRNRYRASYDCF